MKKLILFAAILFAGVSMVNAEEGKSSLLTVKLNTFQSISVSGNALIEFENAEDYTTETEVNQTASESDVVVNVSSAGAFFVRVYAADLEQSGSVKRNILNSALIQVSATPKSDNAPTNEKGAYAASLAGNNADDAEVLIQSLRGDLNMTYDVSFKALNAGEAYRNSFNLGDNNDAAQIYTTTVYYEVSTN